MRPYHQVAAEQKGQIRAAISQMTAARPEVLAAFLFGSFPTEPRFHDFDVAVIVDLQLVSHAAAPGLASDLATELEWKTGLPVDLIVLNFAPIALRYHASRGEVLFQKDQEVLDEFLERTWKEYLDFEPFLRSSLKDLLQPE